MVVAAMVRAAVVLVVSLLLLAGRPIVAQDTPSPNDPIAKPECDADMPIKIRYSSTSERLYLESADGVTRGGCITINDVWEQLEGRPPLYPVVKSTGNISDTVTGVWLLTESLYVEDGITLQVHGSSAGGNANELLLLSTSETYINLRAHGGNLDFVGTKVFAWDTAVNWVDKNEDDGRSYISAISEVVTDVNQTCDGRAKSNMGEARMDIEDTEMGYLGFHDGESYGLTWKVRGFCKDLSNPEVFDDVNVYGNIYDSLIHHNRFGVYTYGHQQGDWRRNKVYHNAAYGFDPHDDSDFLTIHDNEVFKNANHGIIASKRCNGVSIQGNVVYGGGSESCGIFLHRSSDDAVVKGNYAHSNGDAGLALMESFNADVSDNIFDNNKYGIRLSVGCADNVFDNNIVSNSTRFNIYTYMGSDGPWVVDSGRSKDNTFSSNTIDGSPESLKILTADGTTFIANTFKNVIKIRFQNSTESLVTLNSGLEDVDLKVTEGSCFSSGSDADFVPVC